MPKFSKSSAKKLAQCHPSLQLIFNEVIKKHDCTILCGHRPEHEQNEAFNQGLSKEQWPNSKHNKKPALAVDVAPFPIDWKDRQRFYYFAGYVLGIAEALGIKLRWGGDWDRDLDFRDQKFDDLPHFELVGDVDSINPPT